MDGQPASPWSSPAGCALLDPSAIALAALAFAPTTVHPLQHWPTPRCSTASLPCCPTCRDSPVPPIDTMGNKQGAHHAHGGGGGHKGALPLPPVSRAARARPKLRPQQLPLHCSIGGSTLRMFLSGINGRLAGLGQQSAETFVVDLAGWPARQGCTNPPVFSMPAKARPSLSAGQVSRGAAGSMPTSCSWASHSPAWFSPSRQAGQGMSWQQAIDCTARQGRTLARRARPHPELGVE